MAAETHVDDLLPGYVLGTLDEGTTLHVAEHVATCRLCREQSSRYETIVVELGLAAPEVPPPPALKRRVMQSLQTPQETSHPPARPWAGIRLRAAARTLTHRLVPVWNVLSVVLVLILSISTLLLWQRVNELQSAPQSLPTFALTGTEAAPNATGLVVVSHDGSHGTLVVDGLPPLGEDRAYQLWLIKDGERTSGGLLSVGDDGYGSLWVSSPDPLNSYTDFGITIEPADGSPGPTGEKVLGTPS